MRLRRLRKEKRVMQADLGAAIGVSHHQVSKMEKGQNFPSYRVLCALADFFDVSLDSLCRGDDEMSDQSNQEQEFLVSELQKKMSEYSLSPKRLSLISGVGERVIQNIVNGKTRRPDVFTVGRLAHALKCSVEDLIGFSAVNIVDSNEVLAQPVYSGDTFAFIRLWEILLPAQKDSFLTILEGIADKTLLSINQNERRAK